MKRRITWHGSVAGAVRYVTKQGKVPPLPSLPRWVWAVLQDSVLVLRRGPKQGHRFAVTALRDGRAAVVETWIGGGIVWER